MQNTQHPDDAAVDALATAMKAKLAKQRAKGYGGWDTDCTQQRLSDMLRTHMEKGDPVDVANFCAFLLARGEAIAAAQQAVQAAAPLPMVELFGVKDGQETSLGTVPMPPTMRARELLQNIGFRGLDDDDGDGAYAMAACEQLIEYCKAYYEAPAHPAEGVPAQAEPFMWAIQEPGGSAYMDKNCVSTSRGIVEAEVDGLNLGLDADDEPYKVVPVYLAAAPQALQADAPLPLLLRDIARDLGITVPQACIALKPLGNYSTNAAVTAEMARLLRDHFPTPAHPAEGVPEQAAKLPPLPEPTAFLVCKGSEVTARAWNIDQMRAYAAAAIAATHPTQQGMDAQDAIRALIAQHGKELEKNEYAYFELAYTRSTGWMAWITDKPLCSPVVNPDRKVLASGQGDTPEAACADALAAQAKQGGA